jgi:hypothetical protein
MPARFSKFTQTDAKRLFRAAANAGVNVRLEFRPDGTIIATTDNGASVVAASDTDDGREVG